MTTKHEVIAVHRAHPDWSAGDIAAHLGCMHEYVRATARRNGFSLPKASRLGTTSFVYLTKEIRAALDGAASTRGLTASELARSIIETVARDNMVDAVLDDRVAA